MAAFSPVGFSVLVLLASVFAYQLRGSLADAHALLTGVDPTSATPGDAIVASGTPKSRTDLVEAPVTGSECVGYIAVLDQRFRSRIIVQWQADYAVGDLPSFHLDGLGSLRVTSGAS